MHFFLLLAFLITKLCIHYTVELFTELFTEQQARMTPRSFQKATQGGLLPQGCSLLEVSQPIHKACPGCISSGWRVGTRKFLGAETGTFTFSACAIVMDLDHSPTPPYLTGALVVRLHHCPAPPYLR